MSRRWRGKPSAPARGTREARAGSSRGWRGSPLSGPAPTSSGPSVRRLTLPAPQNNRARAARHQPRLSGTRAERPEKIRADFKDKLRLGPRGYSRARV